LVSAQKSPPPAPAEDAQNASGRRLVWAALALATLVAAALRLPFLDHQSLWLDEVFTSRIVREGSLSALWRHVEATESTPPLYYLLAWLLRARSAAAMRAIPALALVAAVPVTYLACRRLVGALAALAAAAIVAVNPMLVWYATDARSYALFVLTALLSVWAFSALLERPRARRYALWLGASLACVWTHYFGVFVVGAEVALLLLERPDKRRLTAAWSGAIALCCAPLLALLAAQSSDERAGFIEARSLARRVLEAVRQFAMGPNVPRSWLEAAGVLLACVALLAGAWLAWRARGASRALLALVATVIAAPLAVAALGITDRFYARNLIVAVPLLAALAAPALLRVRAAPLALYLALATLASVWVATDWRYEQADWRSAIARAEAIDPSAPVVAVTKTATPVVQAYLARPPIATGGLSAREAWEIVEPLRPAGRRALTPAPAPALPGFVAARALELRGFRLILELAPHTTPLAPAAGTGASVFSGR